MIILLKFLLLFFLTTSVFAADNETLYNSFTQNFDYIRNLDDLSMDVHTTGTVSGSTVSGVVGDFAYIENSRVAGGGVVNFRDNIDMNNYKIIDLGDAINPKDAVNLDTLLAHIGITLRYWFGNQTLDLTLTDSEMALPETPDQVTDLLTTIRFTASLADTATPVLIAQGTIIDIHFNALVDSTSGKYSEALSCQFGYVDSNGSSNFVQIGTDSETGVVLTTSKVLNSHHIHVTADITVPADKRYQLRQTAHRTGSAASYPQISVYYDHSDNHIAIPVAGTVIGSFIKKLGDTTGDMTSDLNLDSDTLVISYDDNKVGIGTASPSATLDVSGDALISSDLGIVEAPPSGIELYVAGDAGISGSLTIGGTVSISSDLTIAGVLFAGTPSIFFSIDGGGSALAADTTTAPITVPYGGTITHAYMTTDQTGSVTIDLWKAPFNTSTLPTNSNSITGTQPLVISSAVGLSQDITSLGTWTRTFNQNDVFIANVDSATTSEKVGIILKIDPDSLSYSP